jgi:protein-S-isoprenylcysteine O-methyltransferase Ste14
MDLIGKTTIHPLLFYTGKVAGYICWVILLTSIFNIYQIGQAPHRFIEVLSDVFASMGLVLVAISLFNLGSSTRLGVPTEETVLKTSGLYRFSRNPMYLGFNLWTISAILITWNLYIGLMGIYSLIIYHFIILGEERFLKTRFGKDYLDFVNKTRRYI